MADIKESKKKYTQEEYLELERKAELKSEYFKGVISVMPPSSLNHNKITANLLGILNHNLKVNNHSAYGSDLRLHIPANTLYTYPDITIVQNEKEQLLSSYKDILLNPVFIGEVFSLSTMNYDLGGKFNSYRSIESLKEYWTISSFDYGIQKWIKNISSNTWILSETTNPNDSMLLESFGLTISIQEVYEGVTF